ncbi:hypothetical protein [Conexibacter woesei]|uniref:hypothetical protein n=1 Tax=Conexibacter woesei TaxID=191495 RepID=UPI000411316D|nr:hypothetical protein [Conexibacter woesei]
MAAEPTHVQEVEAILASTAAERRALLEVVSPVLRASLPVDGTGIAQAIEHLGAAVELAEELRAEQREGHRANPAVLHGRVFGRAPLSPDTVLAAFVDGARVRAAAITSLAGAIGGDALVAEVRGELMAHPLPSEDAAVAGATDALEDAYAAQERVVLTLAAALDAGPDGP